ncbi:hypothetical protein HK097_003937, partial [Rhizophlyctis rosea]
GKHDGTVRQKRYFQCEENHGLFVKSEKVVPVRHVVVKRAHPAEQHHHNTNRHVHMAPDVVEV